MQTANPTTPLSASPSSPNYSQLPQTSCQHPPKSSPRPPKSSPLSTPTTRRLAPRHPAPFASSSQDKLKPPATTPLSHYRASSPGATAAAMSLGTLAAAASLAAAAVPSSSPRHAATYSLTHMPHNFPVLPPTAREDHPKSQPQPVPTQTTPHLISQSQALRPAAAYPAPRRPEPHQVAPVLKPLPTHTLTNSKGTNAKPVAPAPNSAMHPSQIPSVPTNPNGKPKQRRYRASPEQLRQLIARFEVNASPTSAELQDLAAKITMPPQSVILWFKNRRARVPHKLAEKAMNAKRKESGDSSSSSAGISKTTRGSQSSKKHTSSAKVQTSQSAFKRTPSFTTQAAAVSLAEMALTLPSRKVFEKQSNRQVSDIMNSVSLSRRHPSGPVAVKPPMSNMGPPPSYRPKAEKVVPYDTELVKKLGSNVTTRGAEFVQSTTLRRPRTLPPTPRVFSQNEYRAGDKVEVLEMEKGICRAWYSATIVGRGGPKELSLGASAAVACGFFSPGYGDKLEGSKKLDFTEDMNEDDNGDGGDSPRTVRSPAASPTPPIAKVLYRVRFEHRYEEQGGKPLETEVLASKIRPAAPFMTDEAPLDWRPVVGEAVEVLKDGTWFVAVTQNFVVRKGYMVSFESGDVEWVRRPRLRPYQIWRGGQRWVTKTKAPLAVSRKGVGLSVTHPPGGKRKRSDSDLGSNDGQDGRETRARSKRSRSADVETGSGPDGLPEGWRVDQIRCPETMEVKKKVYYMAPDGCRLRSLKEAQRYVRMMGPV